MWPTSAQNNNVKNRIETLHPWCFRSSQDIFMVLGHAKWGRLAACGGLSSRLFSLMGKLREPQSPLFGAEILHRHPTGQANRNAEQPSIKAERLHMQRVEKYSKCPVSHAEHTEEVTCIARTP